MAKNKSYVLWNNKGGVGKSTITFHIAATYAEQHPDEDIIVVDLCPQANVSMMLMGGGRDSEQTIQNLITQETPKTIVGYLTESIISGPQSSLAPFISKVHETNANLSENLYLVSGDGNLELIAPLLSQRADAPPLSSTDKPWKNILSLVKTLTGLRIDNERSCTYFIDTNPSFSIYTQMAIVGGEKLLVPINADDSSIFAITGLFNLIWGSRINHPVYGGYTFAAKAQENKIERPKIALLLGNRFTQRVGAAHAFRALSREANSKLYEEYKQDKKGNRFIQPSSPVTSQEDFEKQFSIELRDFNSAGVVAANQGLPMSKMMDQQLYKVYGQDVQIEKKQRELCKEAIEDIVRRL